MYAKNNFYPSVIAPDRYRLFCAEEHYVPQPISEIDLGHTKWIDSVIRSILTIKPGATRKDLLGVFTEEGGLSTRTQRTYVYRRCRYIKVDVRFAPIGNEDNGFTEMPEDKVITISRPYLQYSVMD